MHRVGKIQILLYEYDEGRINPTNANIEPDFDRAKDYIAHFKVTSSERGTKGLQKSPETPCCSFSALKDVYKNCYL